MTDSYDFASISCGRDHTLALLASGKVFGWGGDGSGRGSSGTPEYCTSTAPTQAVEVKELQPLVSVSAGHGVSLAITAGDQIAVWGASSAGVGGHSGALALASPHYLTGMPAKILAVAAGEFLFGAIDADGTIFTWGLNDQGALGRPTANFNAPPEPVTATPPASQLALGKGYMLALTRAGDLYAWGSNAAGQLGLGHLQSVTTPTPLPLKTKLGSIAAGATHTLALTTRGAVLAWGSNHHGQLGRAKPAYSASPLPVELPERMRSVAAGMHFSLALGESGQVYAWGWNALGQLGLNDTGDRASAASVPGLARVQSIAAGETHAAALGAEGLSGWGNNAYGQLGAAARKQLRPASFFAVN